MRIMRRVPDLRRNLELRGGHTVGITSSDRTRKVRATVASKPCCDSRKACAPGCCTEALPCSLQPARAADATRNGASKSSTTCARRRDVAIEWPHAIPCCGTSRVMDEPELVLTRAELEAPVAIMFTLDVSRRRSSRRFALAHELPFAPNERNHDHVEEAQHDEAWRPRLSVPVKLVGNERAQHDQ